MTADDDAGRRVSRMYEQPPGAVSCYADITQIVRTEHEVIIQFYEGIPGIPNSEGNPDTVRNVLRATIIVHADHASRIGRGLIQAAAGGPSGSDPRS